MTEDINLDENPFTVEPDDVFLLQNEDAIELRADVSDNKKDERKKKRIFKRNRSFSLIDGGIEETSQRPHRNVSSVRQSDYFPTHRQLTNTARVKPKPSKASLRLRKLNTMLLEAVKYHSVQEIERIIKAGASPDSTCGPECVSACQLAALRSDDALAILIKYGGHKMRPDRVGRTALHIAAWAGNAKQVAIILGFSEDLQNKVNAEITEEGIEEIKQHRDSFRMLVNVKCELPDLTSNNWKDYSIDDHCKDFDKNLPVLQAGWTPLHAACVRAEARCVKLLLAAGADPCAHDVIGRTPLDIVGLYIHIDPSSVNPNDFAEVVSTFVDLNCYNLTIKNGKSFTSPLHIAVMLGSLEAVKVLAEAKMPVNWLDRDGMTPLHLCVKQKLKEHLQILANFGHTDDKEQGNVIDVRDKDQQTVLHKAISDNWLPGVCVAIEAGADIIAKDLMHDTPIHFAAIKGNLEILNEVLAAIQNKELIDTRNKLRETPLFKAVIHGHAECTRKILEKGASIELVSSFGVNVFHIAAMKGNINVLREVLDHNYELTRAMINYLTADFSYGPIHFAVLNNFPGCLKLLLSRNAYVKLKNTHGRFKGSTPMHLAAMKNNVKIAKILLKHDSSSVGEHDGLGWTPLHTASFYGSRDMITFLIENGGDLSAPTKTDKTDDNDTVVQFIMNNLSKPTDFLENILDRCISTDNSHYHDKEYKVTVDYDILLRGPEESRHMRVLQALVRTGNRHGQRRLLVHPVVESFLHLKWKTLLPFFYVMFVFHCIFVTSLTTYVLLVLYNIDNNHTPAHTTTWAAILYLSIILIISLEVLYLKLNRRYFMQCETWMKLASLLVSAALPPLMTLIEDHEKTPDKVQWPRHVASLALLISWLQMMFQMSKFPEWGYYVLMFGTMVANVVKIILTFVFVLIGFSLSLMIEFHSRVPFESPLASIVKTIFMVTSEFDYNDMVKEEHDATSILVARFIMIAFIFLVSIVLMNLMVGVAVNDIQNLQLQGNIMRLTKQVEYSESIENLLYKNKFFDKILPKKLGELLRFKTVCSVSLRPGDASDKCNKVLPKSLREVILEKAHENGKRIEEEKGSESFKKKLEEIHDVTVNKNVEKKVIQDTDINRQLGKMATHLTELNAIVENEKSQTKQSIDEIQYCIEELHSKIDRVVDQLEKCLNKS